MLSITRTVFRYRKVHPKSFAAAATGSGTKQTWRAHALTSTLRKPVILDDLSASVPPEYLAASPGSSPAAAHSTAPSTITGRQLWASSQAVRENRHLRRAQGACVVGGAKAIRRIWREYGLQPNVVYVPNTFNATTTTAGVVPEWCLEQSLPTVLVRCSPVDIKRHLLSAEYSDGFAAEFPLASARVSPVSALFAPDTASGMGEDSYSTLHASADGGGGAAAGTGDGGEVEGCGGKVGSMVVLVGLRIPSNVGILVRAAVDMGYDSVLLVNCVDPFQEKVLRASEGTMFSPRLRIFEMSDAVSCVSALGAIAATHGLLPLLAVPSQDAEPAFQVAKRFHAHNAKARRARADGRVAAGSAAAALGPMLVLGSESQGLHELDGEWQVPFQVVTLPLPNLTIDSYNVSVAGSVLCDLFAPSAESHFSDVVRATGEREEDLALPLESPLGITEDPL